MSDKLDNALAGKAGDMLEALKPFVRVCDTMYGWSDRTEVLRCGDAVVTLKKLRQLVALARSVDPERYSGLSHEEQPQDAPAYEGAEA